MRSPSSTPAPFTDRSTIDLTARPHSGGSSASAISNASRRWPPPGQRRSEQPEPDDGVLQGARQTDRAFFLPDAHHRAQHPFLSALADGSVIILCDDQSPQSVERGGIGPSRHTARIRPPPLLVVRNRKRGQHRCLADAGVAEPVHQATHRQRRQCRAARFVHRLQQLIECAVVETDGGNGGEGAALPVGRQGSGPPPPTRRRSRRLRRRLRPAARTCSFVRSGSGSHAPPPSRPGRRHSCRSAPRCDRGRASGRQALAAPRPHGEVPPACRAPNTGSRSSGGPRAAVPRPAGWQRRPADRRPGRRV